MAGDHTTVSSQDDGPTVTRRRFARAATAGSTSTVFTALATAAAAAASRSPEDYRAEQPDHVTVTDDREWLEHYRPALDTRHVPYENRPTLRGWRATSPDRDTDVGVYVAEYAVQKDWLKLTSHPGDHEWIYVHVDSETGEVTEVDYTAYHWLRGYVLNPPVDGSDGGDHPVFQAAKTYHNYVPLPEPTGSEILFDVEPLGDPSSLSGAFYQWIRNGMGDDLQPGAVHDPWLLDSDGPLDAWWARDGSGSVNRYMVDAWAMVAFGFGVGIRGAENADFGDGGR